MTQVYFASPPPMADLRAKYSYDPETGLFTRRVHIAPNARKGTIVDRMMPTGYLRIVVNRRGYFAHRVAWYYQTGEWPLCSIDHINCDKTDNRFANLRLADDNQNARNRRKSKKVKSRFKGAYETPFGRWRATIRHGKKTIHLGTFATAEEAHAAYFKAAQETFGEYARAS